MHQRIQYLPPSPSSSSPPQPQIGTILFRGEVPPTQGEWLGIEWDDASRGKHSGVHEKTGIRYFRTRVEGAGSFLRPTAPGLTLEGKSFVEAFRDKYVDLPTSTSTSNEDEATTSKFYKTESNFEVEVVMSEKVAKRFRDLGRLREAGLEWEQLSCAFYDNEENAVAELAQWGSKLSGLKILNLSCSLLPRIQEAERIVKFLPRLSVLSLNSNRFEALTPQPYYASFKRLSILKLNNTLLTWPDVVRMSPSLPNLVELQFGFNRLKMLEPLSGLLTMAACEVPILQKVETLNLEANELSDWTETIRELSKLPSLSTLILASNRFDNLSSPPSSPDICLRKLRHLSLTSNLLSSWSTTIDVLGESASSTFPALASLRLEKNPLTSPSPSTATSESANAPSSHRDSTDLHLRLLLLARLPFLTSLENSSITSVEREDAERFWVTRIGENKGALEGLSDWARSRFEELRKKHFSTESSNSTAVATSSTATPSQSALKSRLIRLRIVKSSPSTSASTPIFNETLELSVLPTLRTLLFRTQLSRLLGKPLPKTKYRLVAWLRSKDTRKETEEEKWMRVEIPAKEEGRDVSWWGFEEGDAIEVSDV